jgi:hypothetical protein
MALFQVLIAVGITIVLVTHVPVVARYSRRFWVVGEGRFRRFVPVADRRDAAADLARYDASPERSAA